MIDIEKQREAEEAIRRSERRFSQAFEASPIPVTISTLGRGETFLEVNDE